MHELNSNGFNGQITLESLPDALTARDISVILNIGYVNSLNLIKYGGLPSIKIGRTYRVSKQNFLNWMNDKESKIINY